MNDCITMSVCHKARLDDLHTQESSTILPCSVHKVALGVLGGYLFSYGNPGNSTVPKKPYNNYISSSKIQSG